MESIFQKSTSLSRNFGAIQAPKRIVTILRVFPLYKTIYEFFTKEYLTKEDISTRCLIFLVIPTLVLVSITRVIIVTRLFVNT